MRGLNVASRWLQPKKGEDGYDKLYKIRPLVDILSRTFLESFKPNEHQAIGVSMVKFKGRISFRQYLPMKPIKRGYKICVRADQTGLVSQFQIYTGKIEKRERELDARVVKDLTGVLVGKYHRVYFDNYFNSIQLQLDLLQQEIYACGTIR